MSGGTEFSHNPEIVQPRPFVIHGSFGRHLTEIGQAAEALNASGVASVIAPHNCEAIGQVEGFVLLEGEAGRDPRDLEATYVEEVLSLQARGGASLFVDPEGRVGKSMAYESGIIQATGGRAFWTERPDDVPFDVDPDDVMSVDSLVTYMQEHRGALPPRRDTTDQVRERWRSLPFPVAHVAEGLIIRHGERLLAVEDGRWSGGRLTMAGTRVRAGESRSAALQRLVQVKMGGVAIGGVSHFATNFMEPDSGYEGSVGSDSFVFDDHVATATTDRIQPRSGIRPVWLSFDEVETLIIRGEIEPNAAGVLSSYLRRVA